MRRKVAHVSPWGVHCGIAKHLNYWLSHTAREHFICAEHAPSWHQHVEDWNTFPSLRCWSRGRGDALRSAFSAALEIGAGIIHLQYDPSFFPFGSLVEYEQLAAARNIRTVVTVHALVEEDLYVWENKKIIGLADQIVGGTPGLVRGLTDCVGRFQISLKRPVRWVPLAVPSPPATMKRGPRGSSLMVLTWGFLGELKGHAEILAAVRLLRGYAPGARYIAAGRAMMDEQQANVCRLRMLASDTPGLLEIREGFMSDDAVYALCQSADCVVLNHQWQHQSSSGTVALSVASGVPVIVSQSPMFGGYAEAGAVKVVSRSGAEGIVDAILDLFTDGGQGLESLRRGRAEMMKRIAAPAIAAQYEEIYREIEA